MSNETKLVPGYIIPTDSLMKLIDTVLVVSLSNNRAVTTESILYLLDHAVARGIMEEVQMEVAEIAVSFDELERIDRRTDTSIGVPTVQNPKKKEMN